MKTTTAKILQTPGSRLLRDPYDIRISDLEPGPWALLGIPWDWSVAGRPGARFAPQTIRKYLYTTTPFNASRPSILCRGLKDLGDVNIVPGDLEATAKRVKEAVSELLPKYRLLVILGGDHSITEWIVEAILSKTDDICLIVFDAHYDLRSVSEGVTSGAWLYNLKSRHPSLQALVLGIADHMNPPYLAKRAEKLGVKTVPALHILENIDSAFKAISSLNCRKAYISIDMDHVAAAWAPGVNSPSPIGLTPYHTVKLLYFIAERFNIVGVDVVEVAPPYDVGDATSMLAAHLLLHLLHAIGGERDCH